LTYSNTIISSADIHLSSDHYKYIKKPFEFFIETVITEKPLITVLAGDYFHGRVNADEDIYHYAIQNLIKLSQYTKYLIVIDGTYSHDYNTLDILETYKEFIPNLFFIKTKETLNLDGLKILCLPEEYPENPIEYYKSSFSKSYDYVFGHGDIEGALLHSGADNTMLKGFKFNKKNLSELGKYVCFGHYHKHQFLTDNLLYIGSLARFKFGEEEDKGFIKINNIFDDCPNIQFITTPSISMNTLKLDDDLDIEAMLSKYSIDDEIKIKIPKVEGIKKELLEKMELFQGKFKVDYIPDKSEDIEDTLEYKDIEKLDVFKQYDLMSNNEIENKKIPKKNLKFFNNEVLQERLKELIDE
jgi:DNA repair exonuclease SbcCD nuclease subunit